MATTYNGGLMINNYSFFSHGHLQTPFGHNGAPSVKQCLSVTLVLPYLQEDSIVYSIAQMCVV